MKGERILSAEREEESSVESSASGTGPLKVSPHSLSYVVFTCILARLTAGFRSPNIGVAFRVFRA